MRRRGAPAWILDLHKFLGTLSLVFVGVHVAALVADNYVHFGAAELFVPMQSSWRPGAVAWGIAGLYLLVAIQLTSWFMRRLPRRLWHAIHLGSFPLFAVATLHGFTAGADNTNVAVQWVALTCGLFVLLLAVVRVRAPRRKHSGISTAATSPRAEPDPTPGFDQSHTPSGNTCASRALLRVGERDLVARGVRRLQLALQDVVAQRRAGGRARVAVQREVVAARSGLVVEVSAR